MRLWFDGVKRATRCRDKCKRTDQPEEKVYTMATTKTTTCTKFVFARPMLSVDRVWIIEAICMIKVHITSQVHWRSLPTPEKMKEITNALFYHCLCMVYVLIMLTITRSALGQYSNFAKKLATAVGHISFSGAQEYKAHISQSNYLHRFGRNPEVRFVGQFLKCAQQVSPVPCPHQGVPSFHASRNAL